MELVEKMGAEMVVEFCVLASEGAFTGIGSALAAAIVHLHQLIAIFLIFQSLNA
jgi:hypothetical protein